MAFVFLFFAKMLSKMLGLFPVIRRYRYAGREAWYYTLMMSTGLTFGTISSLYALNAGVIDRTQFSLLVTVVVLSAIVPTAIAQRWFSPDVEAEAAADAERRGRSPEPASGRPLPAGEHV